MTDHNGIRTRQRLENERYFYESHITGTHAGTYSSEGIRWKKYEWMADQINPIQHPSGRRRPGFVQHIKLTKTYNIPSWTIHHYGSGYDDSILEVNPNWSTIGDDHYPHGDQSPTGSPTDPSDKGYSNMIPSILDANRFKDLCFEAWTKLKTQVPTEVEVLNFIYELKDFKHLAKSLAKAPRVARDTSLGSTYVQHLKGAGKLKKGAKAVNDSFLSWNFMWAPFISDIRKLTELSDSVAKRMDFLRKTRGKEVIIRFVKKDCYQHPLLDVDQHWGPVDVRFGRNFRMERYACDFIVTAKLYQELEGLDDAYAGLRATIAALGINNPAKAVWNAIPFSFIVDWVAPFGDWLERAAIQPFKGVWNVYDITTSVRERHNIMMHLGEYHGGGWDIPDYRIVDVDVDRYLRLVGLPQTLSGFDFSQLTQQQQKLFLSLALTKVL